MSAPVATPQLPADPAAAAHKQAAMAYLGSLLNRTLRVYTSDGRMFSGTFKCTDAERNVILANAFEYRLGPARAALQELAQAQPEAPRLTADVTPRFMGLVVVPGQYIVKIEVEEARGYGGG